jgi:hypothetical protein
LRTLASTSSTLLRTVLDAETYDARKKIIGRSCVKTFTVDVELARSLSQLQFSRPTPTQTTAQMRGKFFPTPDAAVWDVHMPLEAMAQVCAAHAAAVGDANLPDGPVGLHFPPAVHASVVCVKLCAVPGPGAAPAPVAALPEGMTALVAIGLGQKDAYGRAQLCAMQFPPGWLPASSRDCLQDASVSTRQQVPAGMQDVTFICR